MIGNEAATEIIDLYEYSKAGKTPPKGKKYKIMIKTRMYEVSVESMTGLEIYRLAGLVPPENYRLDIKEKGQINREVGLDERIDFTKPGIEKFTYVSRDQLEG